MVYTKSNIKVLLGPEKLRKSSEDGGDRTDRSTEHSDGALRVGSRRAIEQKGTFGKIGETNVYKRIRHFQALQSRPKLERYPSNLELSGQKVESEDSKSQLKSDRSKNSASTTRGEEADISISGTGDEMDRKLSTRGDGPPTSLDRDSPAADNRYSPTLIRAKRDKGTSGNNNTMSNNFLTEFGLRTERTDTFSGHQRRRGASADFERQLEMSAERHIRTCQVVGNLKRSSRAQQSCRGLKETVSPLHKPSFLLHSDRSRRQDAVDVFREKSFFRSDTGLNKGEEPMSYMVQIRKHVTHATRVKPLGRPFQSKESMPGINSRTIIVGTKYC